MLKPLLLILLWSFPTLLYSQARVNIQVSAQVMGSIEMITIETLNFLDAERSDAIITVDPLNSSNAGKMIARGSPGTEFRLNYLREQELTNIYGNSTLFFTYQVAGSGIDDQATAEMLDQEIRDLYFNEDGEFYLWIGGFVNLSEAGPGSYEGEFTVEIEYI